MSRLITGCTLLIFILSPLSSAIAAGEKEVAPVAIETLTTAVIRLAAALEAEQKSQTGQETMAKLNLAIAYLSFRSRRIETLDRDIAALKTTLSNTEEAEKTWSERILALVERQKQNQGAENLDLNRMIEDGKTQLTVFKERQTRLGENIIQQENRSYELQREISVIEKYVEEHLDL